MKRLACIVILLAGFGCDGGGDSDGSDTDGSSLTDAVVSDGSQDATGPSDATGSEGDGGSVSDRGASDAGLSPPDQMLAPDVGILEQCRAVGRCTPEGAWCEPAGSPECWRGESPQCFEPLHPLSRANCEQPAELMAGACACPEGFDVAPGQDSCSAVSSQRAVQHAISRPVCPGVQTSGYGTDGALYEDTDGNPENDRVVSDMWGPQSPDDQTSGRLNQAGVWACDWQVRDQAGFEPFNEWIGFSHCLSADAPGDYLVGISGDEQARLFVNGQLVFETPQGIDASRTWYIRRLSLPSGINTIEFHGLNMESIGAIGGEIIGPFEPDSMATEAAQKAADYENNVLFSTRSLVGTQFSVGDMTGWYCRNEGEVLNTCHAEPRCSTIERRACEVPPLVCPMGQHDVDGACLDNECTCAFGVPLLGADCAEHDAPGCRACFEGYGLEEGVCVENVCTCDNGVAAVSAACDEHNAEICLVCNDGYEMRDRRCEPWQCVCANGTAAEGPACPAEGNEFCLECDAGFHLDGAVCQENVCQCRNGQVDADAFCEFNNGDACQACDDGFYLEDGRCRPNLCQCDNGNGAIGAACPANGDALCTECMNGFQLVDGACQPNQCVCINGVGAQGLDCPNPGRLQCESCDEGYRLEGRICVQSDCRCANGRPVSPDLCPGVGVNLCRDCNDGYTLVDGQCQANTCECVNGEPAVGELCLIEGEPVCINCDPGFVLDGNDCVAQQCVCANGVASQGIDCPRAGAEHCQQCDAGYQLRDDRCELIPVPRCDDAIQNGSETDVDCGGECDPCGVGDECDGPDDCESDRCDHQCGDPAQCELTCLPAAVCGDGVVEDTEACDDGNAVTEECEYDEINCTVCAADCTEQPGVTRLCGDGNVDPEEQCDDNNGITEECAYGEANCTICAADCTEQPGATRLCGDGNVDPQEQCDDNNTVTEECDYGQAACTVCAADCTEQAGVTHVCGDGSVDRDNGETCDDNNTVTEECAYGEANCTVCAADCTEQAGVTHVCGDGTVDRDNGETCDDNNTVTEECAYGELNCTVCAADCTEQAGVTHVCGDGTVDRDNGETCDDNNTVTEECAYGEANCTVCAADCTEQAGVTHVCGDGIIDRDNGETCDDNNTITEECAYGEANCTVCTADCTEQPGATRLCGDGIINRDNGETCDDNNTITEECAYGEANCTVCAADCTEQPGVTHLCGDGVIDRQNGETCDDNNAITEDCDYGQPNCTICAADCTERAGTAQFCGDGRVNGPEQCDDNNTETEECDYGQFACTVCAADCTEQAGVTRRCGDGVVDRQNGETCDDQNQNSNDGCTNECQLPACDDQIRNGQESDVDCGGECDGCRLDFLCNKNEDCQSNRCGPPCGDIRQCPTVCLPAPVCGNNIIEDGEDCDDGNAITEDCPYGEQSCRVCGARCQTVDGRTSFCGDGRVDDANGEACDDNNQDNQDECTNTCERPACDDQIRNGQESDVDCGGPCEPCREGDLCNGPNDCDTNRCGIDAVQPGEVIGPAGAECDAGQIQGGLNQDAQAANGDFANDERLFAVEFRVADGADLDIDEVEFYLGQTFVQSEVYLFGHNSELGRPGDMLARSPFTIQRQEGWQGGRFGRAITLQAGTSYWLGMKLMGGRSSFAVGGIDVNYTFKFADGDRWDRVFAGPIMARVSLCDDAVGDHCDADGNCAQVCLPAAVCGNGIIEGAETCDDGNLRIENCDYGQESCTVCDDQCQQLNGATSFCGDGILDVANGEVCDDGDDNDANACNNSCEEQVACQGCECDVERCNAGDAPAVIDTLNFDGMTFRPLDLDECVPGEGNCCPGSTTQSSLDAFCRLAGHCRAIDWTVEVLRNDNCYGWGGCTRCTWFSNFCFGGATDRRFVTSVTCL